MTLITLASTLLLPHCKKKKVFFARAEVLVLDLAFLATANVMQPLTKTNNELVKAERKKEPKTRSS